MKEADGNKGAGILVVPNCEKGRGGGHISRAVFLVNRLEETGRDVFLWIPENRSGVSGFFPPGRGVRVLSRGEELFERRFDFIVLDNYKTTREDFAFWSGLGVLVGIDEGGAYRSRFDFLVDLLPGISSHAPNISAPRLLPLPKNRQPENAARGASGEGARVLVSFGAEDSAGLGFSAARSLSASLSRGGDASARASVTLIAPSLDGEQLEEARKKLPLVNVTGKIGNLKERLAEYDLLITHFGLGAFEAVYARVPVLLFSPSPYHKKLGRNAGFLMGNKRLLRRCFNSGFLCSLAERGREIARRFGLEETQKEDFASYVNSLSPKAPRKCPVCGEDVSCAAARFREESYRRCPFCGIIFLGRLTPPPIEYGKEYFFGFYKKQYGKTYLEDFPNLKETGRKRLVHIKNLLQNKNAASAKPSLLDIGCAYGPFLSAASESGFAPSGIDPAEDAIRYVKEELGFPALRGFFPDALNTAVDDDPRDRDRDPCGADDHPCGADDDFYGADDHPRDADDHPRDADDHPRDADHDPYGADDDFYGADDRPRGADHDSRLKKSRYDAVTLWYVVEHFEEPGKVLTAINGILKSGGVLAFSTPSYTGVSGRKSLRGFLKNSPRDHWTIWSPRACKKILRQYGFTLRKISVTGIHPERFPLFGRFFRSAGKKGALFRLLLFAGRVFRLGDTFEAYAVKTGGG